MATVGEIDELQRIIDDHPLAESLRLDWAREIAGGPPAGAVALSEGEREVLGLLRRGLTNKQMAAELFVTPNTVKFHRGNLMRKVGASTRQQLLEEAARTGL